MCECLCRDVGIVCLQVCGCVCAGGGCVRVASGARTRVCVRVCVFVCVGVCVRVCVCVCVCVWLLVC